MDNFIKMNEFVPELAETNIDNFSFPDKPATVEQIQIPDESLVERIEKCNDIMYGDLLKQMVLPVILYDPVRAKDLSPEYNEQSKQSFDYAVRLLSQRASENNIPIQILQIRRSIPLLSLSFQEDFMDLSGDFMNGLDRKHKKPAVCSSSISDIDYTERVCTDDHIFSGAKHLYPEHIVPDYLNPIMGNPACYQKFDRKAKSEILAAYNQKKGKGDIEVRINADPIVELESLYSEGKRFDLIFPDLTETADRMREIQAVVLCLSEGGYAFVPIRMGFDDPKSKNGWEKIIKRYLDDSVVTKDRIYSFEEYLAKKYPQTFKLVDDGFDSSFLVIRGGKEPVKLPEFEASPGMGNPKNGVSIRWILKEEYQELIELEKARKAETNAELVKIKSEMLIDDTKEMIDHIKRVMGYFSTENRDKASQLINDLGKLLSDQVPLQEKRAVLHNFKDLEKQYEWIGESSFYLNGMIAIWKEVLGGE